MEQLKRPIYDAFLPPTPCRQSMREQLDQIAEEHQTSVASVIRHAVSLFLEGNSQKSRGDQSKTETAAT